MNLPGPRNEGGKEGEQGVRLITLMSLASAEQDYAEEKWGWTGKGGDDGECMKFPLSGLRSLGLNLAPANLS